MSNNHILTKNIGDLRGFSTDSIYLRPANVADRAINIQKAPDNTLQLRRGYQCQIGLTGGMGIGTFDDPETDTVQTVSVGFDGFLYNKLNRQIFFYYDGRIMKNISSVSNANPAVVTSVGHGLQTGSQVIIRAVTGFTSINNLTFTVTVIDADNFSLDGSDTTADPAYTTGGTWSIAFADQRYLTFSIFVDPQFIYNNAGQSISSNTVINRAAQVTTNQNNVNTINVQFGQDLIITDKVEFATTSGVIVRREVVASTPTTITIDGDPVSVLAGAYIDQVIYQIFGKGFDTGAVYDIANFIQVLTAPISGIFGLQMSINGLDTGPAAFLQIVEPTVIFSGGEFRMDYWYWEQINSPQSPPFPGSANQVYQNSPEMENASMAVYDDIIYIANGWDYPQKYDGQNVYRAGMPQGVRPVSITDNATFTSKPLLVNEKYQYLITYEQIDNRGHIVEGEISSITDYTVAAATAASNVEVANLTSSPTIAKSANNWNTNGALCSGGAATVYGPDINGYYYDLVSLTAGFTLKRGDSAYYGDLQAAVFPAGAQASKFTLTVNSGHAIVPGDFIYFFDSVTNLEIHRRVIATDTTTITIDGNPVTVNGSVYPKVLCYKVSEVFGNVAIVNGNQSAVNTITVDAGHTIQALDIVQFIDENNDMQRRNVASVTGTTIVIDGIPVGVSNDILIYSENLRTNAVNLRRLNSAAAVLSTGTGLAPFNIPNVISNNLRINIYRTLQNQVFGQNDTGIFLVASLPNNSIGGGTQIYIDGLIDAELQGRSLVDQNPNINEIPTPPPISKYLRAFGNQLFYAGGERGNAANSDFVFFSNGLAPEVVPLATNFFSVPNVDDDITGIGVSGSTLITTKNHSLWSATGNFLTGDIQVVQVAPGTNIGCVAHATIASIGTLMYFTHTNGVYALSENQLYPTDAFANPVPISLPIDVIFRETNYLPQNQYVFKRAVAINYTKDNQYLLFLPCEDVQSTIRTANANSIILCYDYMKKNWFTWTNMNAAGGMVVIDDNLYFQERRTSSVDGNSANLYKQHRFYRLVDHADHAGAQFCEWLSSWEDLGQPEVRKKFCRCVLLMDRVSELLQYNNPQMVFSTYLNRIPNLQSTISTITQTDNIRNASWSYAPWGWNYWSGYQDSFVTVNLKQGTVAKSIQVGFTIQGINMDIRLAGFQLEAIPENRVTVVR
jgi:hypothetical protein